MEPVVNLFSIQVEAEKFQKIKRKNRQRKPKMVVLLHLNQGERKVRWCGVRRMPVWGLVVVGRGVGEAVREGYPRRGPT
jgi:hypothetical protein